jgi:hypothetical protein
VSRRVAAIAGGISVVTLGVNWGVVAYMSLQYNPGSIRLWEPFKSHPAASFGLCMAIGICSGVYAGLRHSRIWFLAAGLNLASYLLELAAS